MICSMSVNNSPDEVLRQSSDGHMVLAEAVDAYRHVLGGRLIAAYALGSLAHGGFSALVSDVDLALILTDPMRTSDAQTVQEVGDRLRAEGSALHERLSVFWGTPSSLRGQTSGGRFPPLDRLDLLEHGRLLSGREARQGVPSPSHDELVVEGAQFALGYVGCDAAVDEVCSAELLLSRGVRRLTKLVLFPVRFLFTARTGRVGTNEAAAAHYLTDSAAPARKLVDAARTWRTVAPRDLEAAASLLEAELIPLYLEYIDDHIERLVALGHLELAEAFRRWRSRLLR
jgi:hypothetical protein